MSLRWDQDNSYFPPKKEEIPYFHDTNWMMILFGYNDINMNCTLECGNHWSG